MSHFAEVVVYRLPEASYYQLRDAAWNECAESHCYITTAEGVRRPISARGWTLMQNGFEKAFGGCWQYNEAIGFLRFYFLGTEIRSEYTGVRRKRIVKTRRKLFYVEPQNEILPAQITDPTSSESILSAVNQHIESCKKHFRPCVLDLSAFDQLAPSVNWRSVFSRFAA